MLVAKQVADLITAMRAMISAYLVWLGVEQGPQALSLAAWLMIMDWSGDAVDGRIARRSRIQYRTWIGDHDLEVDMTVSVGLLIYLVLYGYVKEWMAVVYVLLWALYFWHERCIPHSPGMLFQAPIYAWLVWVSLHDAPAAGWAIVTFIVTVVVLTWPAFPKVVIPGFLRGMRRHPTPRDTGS
jgi:hypothetical protein